MPAGGDDRAARLGGDADVARGRQPRRRPRATTARPLGDRRRALAVEVRDPEAAADAQLARGRCGDEARREQRDRLGSKASRRKIWLPMWAWTPTSSTPSIARERARAACCGGARGEREAELRVLLAGPDELVGVRLDARRHPQEDRLGRRRARRAAESRSSGRSRRRSRRRYGRRRRRAPARARRRTCCCRAGPAGPADAGGQRDSELAAGRHVEQHPLLGGERAPSPCTGTPSSRTPRPSPNAATRLAAPRAELRPRRRRTAACRTRSASSTRSTRRRRGARPRRRSAVTGSRCARDRRLRRRRVEIGSWPLIVAGRRATPSRRSHRLRGVRRRGGRGRWRGRSSRPRRARGAPGSTAGATLGAEHPTVVVEAVEVRRRGGGPSSSPCTAHARGPPRRRRAGRSTRRADDLELAVGCTRRPRSTSRRAASALDAPLDADPLDARRCGRRRTGRRRRGSPSTRSSRCRGRASSPGRSS